jgi:hypothetical protein
MFYVGANIILCILIVEIEYRFFIEKWPPTCSKKWRASIPDKKASQIHQYVTEIEKDLLIWLSFLSFWWAKDDPFLCASMCSVSILMSNIIGIFYRTILIRECMHKKKYEFY